MGMNGDNIDDCFTNISMNLQRVQPKSNTWTIATIFIPFFPLQHSICSETMHPYDEPLTSTTFSFARSHIWNAKIDGQQHTTHSKSLLKVQFQSDVQLCNQAHAFSSILLAHTDERSLVEFICLCGEQNTKWEGDNDSSIVLFQYTTTHSS
jgi:hypothetical protein